MIATPILGGITVVSAEVLPNGVHVLQMDYDGTYDGYKDLPAMVRYEGRTYGKSGHNSDTMRVYYRTDRLHAVAV